MKREKERKGKERKGKERKKGKGREGRQRKGKEGKQKEGKGKGKRKRWKMDNDFFKGNLYINHHKALEQPTQRAIQSIM